MIIEVGDKVSETWDSSPNKQAIYTVTKIDGDNVYYDRCTNAYCNRESLKLVSKKEKIYTVEDFKTKDIAVKISSKEDWKKLKDISGTLMTTSFNGNVYYSKSGYVDDPSGKWYTKNGFVLIDFSQIDFEEPKKENVKKPFERTRDITYEMITTHPYFRTLTEKKLAEIINFMCSLGYTKLEGAGASGKAKKLIEKFKKENQVVKKYKLIKDLPDVAKGTVGELKSDGYYTFPTIAGKGFKNRRYKLEAILASPDFFEEVIEFKEGDIVYAHPNTSNIWKFGKYLGKHPNIEGTHRILFEGENDYLNADNNELRLATEEEIKEYKERNFLPTIRGKKVKIEDGMVTVGCQSWDYNEIKTIKRLLSNPINSRIYIGESELTISIIDKILNYLSM